MAGNGLARFGFVEVVVTISAEEGVAPRKAKSPAVHGRFRRAVAGLGSTLLALLEQGLRSFVAAAAEARGDGDGLVRLDRDHDSLDRRADRRDEDHGAVAILAGAGHAELL